MEQERQKIEDYVSANLQDQVEQEMKRASKIANLVADFQLNEKGEELANIQTCEGFQAVWDFRGTEKKRWRLDRKKEQVSANYNASTHLF